MRMGEAEEKEKISRKIIEIINDAFFNGKMTAAEVVGMLEVIKDYYLRISREIAEAVAKHRKTKEN